MGDYDKIIKENLEAIFLSLAGKYLGFTIKRQQKIEAQLQVTLEREPDFLAEVETMEGEKFILHLEFQVEDDPDMMYRMMEYKAVLQRKHGQPVRQFVIYMGRKKKPSMPSQLPEDWQITGFGLANIRDQDYQQLLASSMPEEVVLAILGDFKQQRPQEAIARIISRLKETASDILALQKYTRQLTVLSKLRNLSKETTKQVTAMPITYDITKDYVYKLGEKEGKAEGKAQGKAEGKVEERTELLTNMILSGELTLEQIAKLTKVPLVEVEKLAVKLKK